MKRDIVNLFFLERKKFYPPSLCLFAQRNPKILAPLRSCDRFDVTTIINRAIPSRFHQMQKELRQQPEIILP